ncbi:MAG: hypothetical protein AAB224_07025 [Gemmatimonadota bacterium]
MNQPLLQMDLRLLGLAVLLLGVAVAAIWRAGRRLRGELGEPNGADGGRGDLQHPPVPPQAARVLQQRGLASPAQLAAMSETERQLLFSSVTDAINNESEPDAAPRVSGARPFIRPEDIPTLYCPTCSYRIERFSSTPPITGLCETCGARIVVRRDGARILLTVLPKDETEGRRPDLRLEP